MKGEMNVEEKIGVTEYIKDRRKDRPIVVEDIKMNRPRVVRKRERKIA